MTSLDARPAGTSRAKTIAVEGLALNRARSVVVRASSRRRNRPARPEPASAGLVRRLSRRASA